jgi:hypothetical protein
MTLSLPALRRLCCAACLAAVIGLGIVSRTFPLGWFVYDKSLGDVLYAVAAYLALALLFPRWRIGLVALTAGVACLAVEFLQLSEVNARLLTVPVLRWFLGSVFSWHDVACYLVGVALTAWGDLLVQHRPLKKSTPGRRSSR